MATMAKQLVTSILLFSLTLPARTQFFDFYPSISYNNPFQYDNTPPTLLINRRPQDFYQSQPNNQRNENNHRRTTSNVRTTRTTEKYNEEILNLAVNKHIPFSSFVSKPGSESNVYSLINNYNNNNINKNNNNGNSFTSTTRTVSTTRRNSNVNNNQSNKRKLTSTEASIHIQYGSNDRNNDNNKDNKENNNNNQYNNNFNVNSNTNERDNNYSVNNNERNTENNNRRVNQDTQRNPNVNYYDTNKNNNIFDDNYYNRRPLDDITTKSPYKNNNFNYNEDKPYNSERSTSRPSYTTQNPYQRPGVKPAIFDGPPITNKPSIATDNPYKTRGNDDFSFPEESADAPVLMTGPDVDRLSDAQRRRLYSLADKTCDRWRGLNLKQVQAIPLLPSPDAVRVNVTECAAPTPLIVGGQGVTIEQFPHQAAVGWRKREGQGYSWKCGGTLISELYVMTAAHCTYQERDEDVHTGPPQAVQLGSTYLDGRNAVVYKVAAAIRHPNYKLPKSYFDVALLKLTSQVRFSNTIRPACLGEPPSTGDKIVAAGWGRTEFGGDQSKELRAVSVTVWDMSQCRNALGTSRKLPEGVSSVSQFCAGEKRGGKDTCQGDSGGAALVRSGCVWVACGVTSLGRGCGSANVPAVYARASLPFVASVAFT